MVPKAMLDMVLEQLSMLLAKMKIHAGRYMEDRG